MTAPRDESLLVHAYIDGELDPAHVLEFEQRLANDPALAAERERLEALRKAIQDKLPREPVPPSLRARVEAALGPHRPARWAALSARPSWQALAASVVLALFLGSGGTWLAVGSRQTETTADLVLAGHLRALMAPEHVDVTSSDRHTVKPWFNGRIPQAPRVTDLSSEGFTLVGGRIDVIGRVPVPTLVYRVRGHLISLSEIPAGAASSGRASREIAGYNIVSWTDDGTTYWAVSDVAAADLEAFAKAFRTGTPEP